MRAEPVGNNIISTGSVVVEVQTVPRLRLDIRLEAARVREVHLDTCRDARGRAASSKAVTAAVWQVVLAGDDKDGTLVRVQHGERAEGEQFTLGDGLLCGFGPVEDAGVEGTGEEEEVLLAVCVGVNDVAVGVIEGLAHDRAEVETGDVVSQGVVLSKVVEARSDCASGGGTAEAEGLVEVR